jgi:hypothetical protein
MNKSAFDQRTQNPERVKTELKREIKLGISLHRSYTNAVPLHHLRADFGEKQNRLTLGSNFTDGTKCGKLGRETSTPCFADSTAYKY